MTLRAPCRRVWQRHSRFLTPMEFSHALADVSGVALFALGMAYAFISADRQLELSRIFAAGLACLGIA
jgi:hypothetical protein